MLDTGSVNINMLQVLEVAEDLLKRSLTCKGLEEKRVDMFPKEGAKMSKDAKDFLERLKKLRGTITDLDDQINKEFEKYSGDVRYFAEYQTGLQDFYPRLVEAEDRISEGLVTPQSLVESDNTLTDTKNFQTSLEELIKVLDNAGEIAKKMSHHDHADITVASFRIRWDNAHKVKTIQPTSDLPFFEIGGVFMVIPPEPALLSVILKANDKCKMCIFHPLPSLRPPKCGSIAWRSSINAGTIWNKR